MISITDPGQLPRIIQKAKLGNNLAVDVLRLDLIHPVVSGNKWFKLKYNLKAALDEGMKGILTFGGNHSNHVAATAAACKSAGLRSIGIIRGIQNQMTPTLTFAEGEGMIFEFISREKYNEKSSAVFLGELRERYPDFLIVPEGGNNHDGVRGCSEILTPELNHDFVFCACGTGATVAGLIVGSNRGQVVVGVNVLKGKNQLVGEVSDMLKRMSNNQSVGGNEMLEQNQITGHFITDRFAFGGYAAYDRELIDFKVKFEMENSIPLDYLYTTKLFFAVDSLLKGGILPERASLLVLHTGGPQGNPGYEQRYRISPLF
jgi:1-aminocyclopropane-1-carboxylate deaminase